MNAQIKPQQIMKTMQDFEKQNDMMNMKEELSTNNSRLVIDHFNLIFILI